MILLSLTKASLLTLVILVFSFLWAVFAAATVYYIFHGFTRKVGISIDPHIIQEESSPEVLGQYIYMGMADIKGHLTCIAVAYKMDYCIKKSEQALLAIGKPAVFIKINKVKVGELVKTKSFYV